MKSATIYRSPKGWMPELGKLTNNTTVNGQLGWSWKVLRDGMPFIQVGTNIMLVCEKQEKLIPASVLKKEIENRVKIFEDINGFKPGKKALDDIKFETTHELHIKAFTVTKEHGVWIDTKNDLLCIDTTSETVADDVMLLLSKDLDYRGHRLITECGTQSFMSGIIIDGCIDSFVLGSAGVLVSTGDKSKKITYSNGAIDNELPSKYITECGRKASKLEIELNGTFFTLNDNLVVSKVSSTDIIRDPSEFDTENDYFDNEFTIRCGQFQEIILALLNTLGEEVES